MNQNMVIKKTVIGGDDSIIIKKCFKTIEGGRTLDVSNAAYDGVEVLKASTPIFKTANGVYFPAIVSGDETKQYAAPSGLEGTCVGVLSVSVEKGKAAASIMTIGVVNPKVLNIAYTGITLPTGITFESDEDSSK